jgi:uncharacterized protein YydD (DUF2326 family)
MIHRIYSDLETFKNLELHGGLNVLLTDRHEKATEGQTRNRAGKSSLVQVIHFALGASAGADSIFRQAALREYSFGLDFDMPHGRVVAERKGSRHGHVRIRNGGAEPWPISSSAKRGEDSGLTFKEWCAILGHEFFGLAVGGDGQTSSFGPTFRSAFSYFARRENDGGFRLPEAHSTKQQPWDQQVAVAFLLGLDWTIPQALEIVNQRAKSMAHLKRAVAMGALRGILSASADLRTQLAIAEDQAGRLHHALERFEVLPEYRELEREASVVTVKLNSLANENTLDEQLLQVLNSSVESEVPPDASALERVYQEAGIALPGAVVRRFTEVQAFHDSVIANRKDYLSAEVESASQRLSRRRTEMATLDRRRCEIMGMLQSRGALDQFQKLQQEASRQDAETEDIRRQFAAAEKLDVVKTELEIERSRLLLRLRCDLAEQSSRVRDAISTFESMSRALYDRDAGNLTFNPTQRGLRTEVRIQGQRSKGIQNMQVFCFDLMLMKLCSARDIGPRFLVHDSHLFDGVDERQVARALHVGAETAAACKWQYLVTLNSDAIPRDLPKGFDLAQHLLPVRLTDRGEDGGLFGFRF